MCLSIPDTCSCPGPSLYIYLYLCSLCVLSISLSLSLSFGLSLSHAIPGLTAVGYVWLCFWLLMAVLLATSAGDQ